MSDFLLIIVKDILPLRYSRCILSHAELNCVCSSMGEWSHLFHILVYTLYDLMGFVFTFLFRPELKLILMSATLNAELFSAYFSKSLLFLQ